MRLNLTIDEELASALDEVSTALGYTRSAVATKLLAFIAEPLVTALPEINLPPPDGGQKRQLHGASGRELERAIAMLAFAAFSRQAARLHESDH